MIKPEQKEPNIIIGEMIINTWAADSALNPRLSKRGTCRKVSAVIIKECEVLANSNSQKVGVFIASFKLQLTSKSDWLIVVSFSIFNPSGRRPIDSGLLRIIIIAGNNNHPQIMKVRTVHAFSQPRFYIR